MLTPAILSAACQCMTSDANKYAAPLQTACDRYSINTPQRLAAFLAQIGHESASLSATAESFDYSVAALMTTFPREMSFPMAQKYGRASTEKVAPLARQMQIASIVYSNRFGNGATSTGDGWTYRGSGLVGTTFKANYKAAGDDLKVDLVANPDLVRNDASTAALVAGFFWINHGLNSLADSGDFEAITRRINPAMAGAADRDKRFVRAKVALGI